ncbi:MAG TPA: glycosyltransferase, partial [Devosiaceae bacterium]|nr:glycosyltransferase [Devosiaceae bacterium]
LGGLCLFSAETWSEIGGFDARYVGWGSEDNDFSDRVRKSGGRMRWIDPAKLSVFHIWHEPSYAAESAQADVTQNRERYLRDKSVYRQVRFLSSNFERPASPGVVTRHRPLVTVAIATRARTDRNRMLHECLKSFEGQTEKDFEILIADNGSTADERRRLARALKPRKEQLNVRLLHIDRPSIPHARNTLTDEADGRYICIMDDDDLALPNRLADHLYCFEKQDGAHGSHGGWIDFDEKTGQHEANTGRDRALESMLFGKGKVSSHPASFYRTDVLRAVRYDESFVTGSDWDLALRMANLGLKVGHTGSYVTLRRWHTENVTFTRAAEQTENGRYARRRIAESLGDRTMTALKNALETQTFEPACANLSSQDEMLAALPSYVGVWRLTVPVSSLLAPAPAPALGAGGARTNGNNAGVGPPSEFSLVDGRADRPFTPNGSGDAARNPARSPAEGIENVMNGDVGVVACGLNPGFHYISDPIKGVAKALRLKAMVEKKLNVAAAMVADAELGERQRAGFDWSRLKADRAGHRVVSRPIASLDQAMTALSRVPADTLTGALVTLIADAGDEEQVFYLASKAVADAGEAANIGRILGEFTGETFGDISAVEPASAGAAA